MKAAILQDMHFAVSVVQPVTVRMNREFSTPLERLFDAWFAPAAFAAFLGDTAGSVVWAHFDATVGGHFSVAVRRNDAIAELRGQYLEIDRPQRLVFTLAIDADRGDQVTIELAALERRSLLVLLQDMDLHRAHDRPRMQLAWHAALERLSAMCSTPANSHRAAV